MPLRLSIFGGLTVGGLPTSRMPASDIAGKTWSSGRIPVAKPAKTWRLGRSAIRNGSSLPSDLGDAPGALNAPGVSLLSQIAGYVGKPAVSTGRPKKSTIFSRWHMADRTKTTTSAASAGPVTQKSQDGSYPMQKATDARRLCDGKSVPESTVPRAFPVDLPGVTTSWLAKANDRSPSAIARGRRLRAGNSQGAVAFVVGITPELALAMAHIRPRRGMLPYWSRLAIAELASQGVTYASLMELFRVGRSTIYRAIRGQPRGYAPMSGRRLLTAAQGAPVAQGPNGQHPSTSPPLIDAIHDLDGPGPLR